jgi:hypothetical protein
MKEELETAFAEMCLEAILSAMEEAQMTKEQKRIFIRHFKSRFSATVSAFDEWDKAN